MPSKAALEPVFVESRKRWRVDIPASKTQNGKRVRIHFKTRQAARDHIDRIDGPSPPPIIDPRLATDAGTARQRLEAAGIDLTLAEVAAQYVEAIEHLGGKGTLLAAASEFRRLHDARAKSQSMGDAVTAFMKVKDGLLRGATEKSYLYSLKKVFAPLHDHSLAEITPADLAKLIEAKQPTSRAMHVRNLRVFWSWASKPPREWANMSVVNALEFRKEAGEGDIVILRLEEVKSLMRAAERYSQHAAIAFALSIFGGVRQAELARLTWSSLGRDHIEICANIAKKGRRRLIPISPTLKAWFAKYVPTEADPSDLVVGPNWREVSCAVRRTAGWDVEARLLISAPIPTKGAWPANAPRHTCASILAATGEPLESLIFQFGHSGGHDLLRRHYVGRMTKKEAVAILAIKPTK